MFLTKIRERQFAKNGGCTYKLSRAVLAGVLAAGCLMPGFAEAATEAPVLKKISKNNNTFKVEHTPGEKTTTITGNISGAGFGYIYWKPGAEETSVEDCTINVNDVNSTNIVTHIYGGHSDSGTATNNKVSISGSTIKGVVYGAYGAKGANKNSVSISGGEFDRNVGGGLSSSGNANENSVSISGDVTIKESVFGGDGKTANGNSVSISGGIFGGGAFNSYVHGGLGATAANGNSVSISGGTFNDELNVYGGYSSSDTANGNSVSISGGIFNDDLNVQGGFSLSDTANGNSVSISGGTITGSVCGAWARTEAKDNKVILVGEHENYHLSAEQTLTGSGINITGAVVGGWTNSDSGDASDNEIHVYGSNTKVGYIADFNKLHFFIDDKMTFGETMLTINGVSDLVAMTMSDTDPNDTNVSIPNDRLAVTVSGKPQASGDKNTIYLVHNNAGEITDFKNDGTPVPVEIGATLSGDGSVALSGDKKDLVLTLKNITVNENGKSLVEPRAAAAFVVNNMSDFMLGTGMEQAKAAAGGVTPIDAGTMAPFAAIGGSNMRYTTGSYVDVNGWNGTVGFAKQADKLLFGVAVEHGRGNYDSYLDNGMHASGDIKSTGGVIFGEYKLDNGVHYDAALRAGRVKSDYNSTATSYDESSTYYGFSLGGGKELTVSDKATVDVYGRYYFSHTNGSDVSIATGEEINFDAVNSHRLRIGGRYTTTLTEKSKAYAGLAWQYEFGGDAKAAINGCSAPTPSLQGHSAIVEAGYKLNAGKNLTLDFNLNGAMGKQRGIGGGIGAQWLF